MAGAFSGSDTDFSPMSSNSSQDGIFATATTQEKSSGEEQCLKKRKFQQSPPTVMKRTGGDAALFKEISDSDESETGATTRLVLVGASPDSRSNASTVIVEEKEEGDILERKTKDPNTDLAAIQATFNQFMQQIQAFSRSNPIDIFRNLLMTLSAQVESLGTQVRDLQLMMLRSSLHAASPNSNSPTLAWSRTLIEPPVSGFQKFSLKEDTDMDTSLAFDDLPKTPTKVPEQQKRHLRLDVTPTSSRENSRIDDPINITNILSTKRSLVFPESLVKILDNSFDEATKPNRDAAIQTDDSVGQVSATNYRSRKVFESSSSPMGMTYVQIKKEANAFVPSPRSEGSSGLLVLADAALKRTEAHECFLRTTETLPLDSDSGRSTSSGSSNGSPNPPTINPSVHRPHFVSLEHPYKRNQQLDGHGHRDGRQKLIVPKPPTSDGSSTSSGSSESKSRKRRKVKQPLPCNYCGKMFNNQSSLRQHESFHRPVRPFKCLHDKCEKAYKTRSELNRHLVVHSGEKKHFCKLCGKKFLRKQYLKTHLLRHHETGITMVTPSGTTMDICNALGKPGMMVATSQHQVPVAVMPSAFVSQAEPLTWRCQLCLKIFVNNEDLMKHVRSYHEKKRPAVTGKDGDETAVANRRR